MGYLKDGNYYDNLPLEYGKVKGDQYEKVDGDQYGQNING